MRERVEDSAGNEFDDESHGHNSSTETNMWDDYLEALRQTPPMQESLRSEDPIIPMMSVLST